jgi:hypothetical protein
VRGDVAKEYISKQSFHCFDPEGAGEIGNAGHKNQKKNTRNNAFYEGEVKMIKHTNSGENAWQIKHSLCHNATDDVKAGTGK